MLIGLTGKKTSGKTTAAELLEEILGGVSRINMKDELVTEMKDNFPDVLEEFGAHYKMTIEELFKLKPPMMRALMINYGTDVRRCDNTDYWVGRWRDTVSGIDGHIICDDLRFINEAEAVKELGGFIIRITRPGADGSNHVSETQMDDIISDYDVFNDGSIDELYPQLTKAVDNFKKLV